MYYSAIICEDTVVDISYIEMAAFRLSKGEEID